MRDEIKPVEEIIESEKKEIKEREKVREKINERECEVCDHNLVEGGYSPEPGVCKGCYEKMVSGQKLKEDDGTD